MPLARGASRYLFIVAIGFLFGGSNLAFQIVHSYLHGHPVDAWHLVQSAALAIGGALAFAGTPPPRLWEGVERRKHCRSCTTCRYHQDVCRALYERRVHSNIFTVFKEPQ